MNTETSIDDREEREKHESQLEIPKLLKQFDPHDSTINGKTKNEKMTKQKQKITKKTVQGDDDNNNNNNTIIIKQNGKQKRKREKEKEKEKENENITILASIFNCDSISLTDDETTHPGSNSNNSGGKFQKEKVCVSEKERKEWEVCNSTYNLDCDKYTLHNNNNIHGDINRTICDTCFKCNRMIRQAWRQCKWMCIVIGGFCFIAGWILKNFNICQENSQDSSGNSNNGIFYSIAHVDIASTLFRAASLSSAVPNCEFINFLSSSYLLLLDLALLSAEVSSVAND